jgi:Mrp family chromosome partitioning ATPase
VTLRAVAVGILLGLAAAAVVLAVVPPTQGAVQVHHVVGADGADASVLAAFPAVATTAPDLDEDAATLLGGRPDAEQVAVSAQVTPGEGTIEVRTRAATSAEAATVAQALGTVLARRAADAGGPGHVVNRPVVALAADPLQLTGARPPPAAVLGAGAAAGLVVGLVVGSVLGRGVSSPEVLARSAGLPVLGRVPVAGRAGRDPAVLARPPARARRRHPVRRRDRAVRELAEAVRDAARMRVVVVLALEPQAGPVSVATDLAVALAQDGERVLLVESGPGSAGSPVQRVADPSPGLREVIAGSADLARTVQRWARGGLDVLPAGTAAHRDAAPLRGDAVAAVLAPLRDRYDRIVLDAPGEPGTRAAVELGRAGDAAVLVVRRRAPRASVTTALAALEEAGVEVRGTVLAGA